MRKVLIVALLVTLAVSLHFHADHNLGAGQINEEHANNFDEMHMTKIFNEHEESANSVKPIEVHPTPKTE